jgi:hypothetical protein
MKFVIGPHHVYIYFNDVLIFNFFTIFFGSKDPSELGILELLPFGKFFVLLLLPPMWQFAVIKHCTNGYCQRLPSNYSDSGSPRQKW